MNMHPGAQPVAPSAAPTTAPASGPAFATVPGTDYATDYDAACADDPDLAPRMHYVEMPVTRTFTPECNPYAASRRANGWSAEAQRKFLEAIAEGHGVDAASRCVGLSASSAYAFRRTAKGAAFALGWRAAALVAREALAETLLVRAMEGTVDTVIRGDTVVTRHRFDNRLALSLLARLDRQAEAAPDADGKAARLVAQEFDAYLDLVGKGEGAARAGLFLAQRSGGLGGGLAGEGGEGKGAPGDAHDLSPLYALAAADRLVRTGVATAAEIDIADLDPAARAEWTAEQWVRAEAAGLVAFAAPPEPEPEPCDETAPEPQLSQHWDFGRGPDDPVRWCDLAEEWRTGFPPPPGFDGDEDGRYGDDDYERTLAPHEQRLVAAALAEAQAADAADHADARDRFFAALAAGFDHGFDGSAPEPVPDATDALTAAEHPPSQPVEQPNQPGHST